MRTLFRYIWREKNKSKITFYLSSMRLKHYLKNNLGMLVSIPHFKNKNIYGTSKKHGPCKILAALLEQWDAWHSRRCSNHFLNFFSKNGMPYCIVIFKKKLKQEKDNSKNFFTMKQPILWLFKKKIVSHVCFPHDLHRKYVGTAFCSMSS